MLDSAVRAHRKHMTSVQAAVSKMGQCEEQKAQTLSLPSPTSTPTPSPQAALEQGDYLPSIHIESHTQL